MRRKSLSLVLLRMTHISTPLRAPQALGRGLLARHAAASGVTLLDPQAPPKHGLDKSSCGRGATIRGRSGALVSRGFHPSAASLCALERAGRTGPRAASDLRYADLYIRKYTTKVKTSKPSRHIHRIAIDGVAVMA